MSAAGAKLYVVTLGPAATCDRRHVRRSLSSAPCQKVTTSGRMRVASQNRKGSWPGSGPGARGLCLRLVGVDRGLLFHGEADVVEAVHEAVLAERIDLEFHRAAVGAADFLGREIDSQRRIGAAFGIVEQFV